MQQTPTAYRSMAKQLPTGKVEGKIIFTLRRCFMCLHGSILLF
uniref:Uncharacterized protein n=1 Tax=Anguilla anguilla TaxID=7936 RepID=A0A0E9U674_ANGAN